MIQFLRGLSFLDEGSGTVLYKIVNSVPDPDPDPYVFGLPGTDRDSDRDPVPSSSKNSKKTLDFYCFVISTVLGFLYVFLSVKFGVNVP